MKKVTVKIRKKRETKWNKAYDYAIKTFHNKFIESLEPINEMEQISILEWRNFDEIEEQIIAEKYVLKAEK